MASWFVSQGILVVGNLQARLSNAFWSKEFEVQSPHLGKPNQWNRQLKFVGEGSRCAPNHRIWRREPFYIPLQNFKIADVKEFHTKPALRKLLVAKIYYRRGGKGHAGAKMVSGAGETGGTEQTLHSASWPNVENHTKIWPKITFLHVRKSRKKAKILLWKTLE